jgi:hypothetical protein
MVGARNRLGKQFNDLRNGTRRNAARGTEPLRAMRVLVFDDPQLQEPYEWLLDDGDDVHGAMRALARQAYRRNRRELPEESLIDQLRAHGRVDTRPYVPPANAA